MSQENREKSNKKEQKECLNGEKKSGPLREENLKKVQNSNNYHT